MRPSRPVDLTTLDIPPDALDRRLRILFVDDEEAVLRVATRLASKEGWDATVASGSGEALHLLEKEPISVIITDYNMAEMNGIELLSLVRERWPDVARVLMTGDADEDVLERAVNQAGITRFIRKPWNPVEVRSVVEEVGEQVLLRRANTLLVARLEKLNDDLESANRRLNRRVEETHQAIAFLQNRWDTALSAISEPITIIDGDLRIRGANQAAAKLAGRTMQELEGEKCHRALFRRREICRNCPLHSGFSGSVDLTDGPEELSLQVHAYPLSDAGEATLCIYHDVTREVEFRRRSAQLEKMAAIGRLAGGVAHELNNPLHGILSFVQLARKPGVSPDKLSRYLQVIYESAVRCGEIIKALTNYARRPSESTSAAVDLIAVARRVLEIFNAITKRHIELVEQANEVFCRGNQNQIQQVLVNLVQNALDATPEGGLVRILVDRLDGMSILAVEDAGPGVPQEARERIFEPFFTTKPEGVGTGLGLAICHGIAHDHHGRLSVGDSSLGGARFALEIPALEPPESATRST